MGKLALFFTRVMEKYLPDSFVIAIFLTLISIFLSMTVQGTGFIETTMYWGDGFWDLMEFTMQMTMILATGYVLAKTPLAERIANSLVSRIHSPTMAIVTATLVCGIGCWINWGFGLIIGVIVAQKLAANIPGVHYPLIIAATYSGFTLYALGLSSTVPLLLATPGHFLEDTIGIIPLSETIFSLPMLIATFTLLITMPIFNMKMQPKDPSKIIEIDANTLESADKSYSEVGSSVETQSYDNRLEKLNQSKWSGYIIGTLGIIYAISHFLMGGTLSLNVVNIIILFLGIFLMGSPLKYVSTLTQGIKNVVSIVLQYPFYAGIMGILAGSGLITTFSGMFISISNAETLNYWGLISAFFVNMLAPSAGGQWAIQGPVMVEAAKSLGTPVNQTAMSVMLGDTWNNLVQPFWVLPILALSGLSLKDVMGYTVLIMVWVGVVFFSVFTLWAYVL